MVAGLRDMLAGCVPRTRGLTRGEGAEPGFQGEGPGYREGVGRGPATQASRGRDRSHCQSTPSYHPSYSFVQTWCNQIL